jgi:hypothetical protein
MTSGPILVFDMDETLISSVAELIPESTHKPEHFVIESISVNMKLVSILYRAIELRKKGKVRAVFLLTNNNNISSEYKNETRNFVDIGCDEILQAYNAISSACKKKYHVDAKELFDYILTGDTPTRARLPPSKKDGYEKPVKSMDDVKEMMSRCNMGTKNMEVYFFDDDTTHMLKDQIPRGNYIHIVPPYGEAKDKTDYSKIESRLTELEDTHISKRITKKSKSKLKELN